MAKNLFFKKLDISDYPADHRSWLGRLFLYLDQFQQSTISALRKRLNFRDNFDADIREIDMITLTQINNRDIKLSRNTIGTPRDVMATAILANSDRLTVPVRWTINSEEQIEIISLDTALIGANEVFTLRLTIFGDL